MDFASLNFWLWLAAIVLALAYLAAGVMKATQPIDKLGARMGWPRDYPGLTRFVGIAEVLGAIGLIVPLATGILPWLTPLAAIGLAIIQVLAFGFHIRRNEPQILPANVVLFALAALVAWGRFALFAI